MTGSTQVYQAEWEKEKERLIGQIHQGAMLLEIICEKRFARDPQETIAWMKSLTEKLAIIIQDLKAEES